MVSIRKDISIAAPAVEVWDAVRDFGALHTRLVPGFVLDTKLDGEARIVTFASGTIARELLVDCDDARLRLAYAIVSERMKHYNASVEIVPDGEARCQLIWIIDVLPHEVASYISSQMDLGASAMQKTFARGLGLARQACPRFSGCDLSHRDRRVIALRLSGSARMAPLSAEQGTQGEFP